MRISTTMFWNLRSMMAATVSSCGLINVGPNTTPRLAMVIRFCLLWAATLTKTVKESFYVTDQISLDCSAARSLRNFLVFPPVAV